jgi:glycosyltransferase involved in cell wall biosynthesis
MSEVTVAIPVRDGGPALAGVLQALAAQSVEHELLVCDSGSHDGSPELARSSGARVLQIAPAQYSHGGTRNLLMREATGAHVALLSQDAEPADAQWLRRMLAGFQLAGDVALVYGPYRPRPGARAAVGIELERWFTSLAPDGSPRVDRLAAGERVAPRALMGARGFFTDANACIARAAWERVPFREVPYAEDRLLALDMLRCGYAKAYLPDAAVLHSHDYGARQELQRGFDEWRALREIYGWREPCSPRQLARGLRGELGFARAWLARRAAGPAERRATLAAVARRQLVRRAGALLGSRADRLPAGVRRRLSLEGRGSFEPLDFGEIQLARPGETVP